MTIFHVDTDRLNIVLAIFHSDRKKSYYLKLLIHALQPSIVECDSMHSNIVDIKRLKFSLIIGDYWRVQKGSKSSGEKKLFLLLNFYQNINSTEGFFSLLE